MYLDADSCVWSAALTWSTWVDLCYPVAHLWTHQRCLGSMPHFLLSYYLASSCLLNKHWLLRGNAKLCHAHMHQLILSICKIYCTVTAVNLPYLQLPKFRCWGNMLHKGGYPACLGMWGLGRHGVRKKGIIGTWVGDCVCCGTLQKNKWTRKFVPVLRK